MCKKFDELRHFLRLRAVVMVVGAAWQDLNRNG
jgi:hypothetical protein